MRILVLLLCFVRSASQNWTDSEVNVQGPVFVMLFVGIVDHASKMMVSGCLHWAALGTVVLMLPIIIVSFGFWKIKKLVKEGERFMGKSLLC